MPTIEQILHARLKKEGINIVNPKTIQDKINWLKFHDSTPLKGKCADKIRLHEYCKEVLGEDICVPIRKTYDKASDIKMADLPNSFVMKTNHGYNMNIICRDKSKFDIEDARKKVSLWLNTSFGHDSGQPHYQYITPRVMVEELLEDENQKKSLFDYKFWCFNGEYKLWTINDGNGHGDIMYYDRDDKPLDLYETKATGKYKKPVNLSLMKEYAEKLAKPFKFVRVDFYEVNGKVYLGEMTFTPGNGFFDYKKKGANEMVGSFLDLGPQKKYPEGVSVCLTGYKAQDYVEETLNSIKAQTWFKTHDNWEMIVGVDGCPQTLEKVKSIMGKYGPHLRVLYMESNCGTYVATNTVMSQAKYEGLIRFDCDDIMLPEMVETIMKEGAGADIVNFQLINFGKRSGINKACGQVFIRHSFFDRIGGYLPWTCSADSELECRVKGLAKTKFIKKVLLRRRVYGGNLTSKKETGYRSTLRMANMRYVNLHRSGYKSQQEAVVVKLTNNFTEITSSSTVPHVSKFPFPKMDVIYQEHMEWKLKNEAKEEVKAKLSAVTDNYVYNGDNDLRRKAYFSTLKNYPAVRKKKAADFLRTYLSK